MHKEPKRRMLARLWSGIRSMFGGRPLIHQVEYLRDAGGNVVRDEQGNPIPRGTSRRGKHKGRPSRSGFFGNLFKRREHRNGGAPFGAGAGGSKRGGKRNGIKWRIDALTWPRRCRFY